MKVSYPDIPYDVSSTNSYNVRSLTTEYGDGYIGITPDGINHIYRSGTIVHTLLDNTDAATLRSFLKQYCGTSTVVELKDCFEDSTGASVFNAYLLSWSESFTGAGHIRSINITFRESFKDE